MNTGEIRASVTGVGRLELAETCGRRDTLRTALLHCNVHGTCEVLSAAARSYRRMLELNEHLAESDNARNYREQITGIARGLAC